MLIFKVKHCGFECRDGADPAHTQRTRGANFKILGTIEQQQLLRSTSSAFGFTVRKGIDDDET